MTHPQATCPVCGHEAEPEQADCELCGRHLNGPLRLGRLSPERLDAADAGLRAACRAWDLAAADRAGPVAGPHPAAGAGRLATLARPGGTARDTPPAAPAADTPTTGLRELARGLRGGGAYRRISILEITPDGMRLAVAEAGDGDPALEPDWHPGWRTICPALSADADTRLFQVAGGIGRLRPLPRAEWDARVGDALADLARRVPAPLLLVDAPPGWTLLERAAAVARAALTPAAVLPALGDRAHLRRLAGLLLRELPPPEGYDVLLAQPGGADGRLTVGRRTLFAPEPVEEGTDRSADLVVYGPGAGGEVLIPVVTHADTIPAHAAAVTAIRLRTTPGEPVRITARQDTPGQVRLVARDAVPDDVPWPSRAGGLDALLRATDPAQEPLDLAVTVELGGGERPLALARALLAGLGEANLLRAPARVAVVAYGDHRPGQPLQLELTALGDPDAAVAALDRARPAVAYEDLLAPLEDALAAVRGLGWRPGGRRIVVPFATRLPHPPRQDWGLSTCARDLPRVAAELRRDVGARVLPVVEARWDTGGPAALDWAKRAWAALSDAPPFDDVEPCLRALRGLLTPSGAEPLRLALAEPNPHPRS